MTISHSEAGYRGYIATEAKYGKRQMDKWRRMGGRKRNKTLAEVKAEASAARALVRARASGATPGSAPKGATGPMARSKTNRKEVAGTE